MTPSSRGAILALVGLALLASGLSWQKPVLAQPKTVTLQFNGLPWKLETQAQDIAELLLQSFGDYENWNIDPAPKTAITDQMTITIQDSSASALTKSITINLQPLIKKREEAQAEPKSPIYAGLATWYDFGGSLGTASRQFPKGTRLKVVAVNSGKSVIVTVNDYGPQTYTGIALDLNRPSFTQLAPLGAGKIQVKYYKI